MALNPSNAEQLKRGEEIAQLEQRREAGDLNFLMTNFRGRRFLWRTLSAMDVFRSPLGSDVHHTYYRMGVKDYGLSLFEKITDKHPDEYLLMVKEAKDEALKAKMLLDQYEKESQEEEDYE